MKMNARLRGNIRSRLRRYRSKPSTGPWKWSRPTRPIEPLPYIKENRIKKAPAWVLFSCRRAVGLQEPVNRSSVPSCFSHEHLLLYCLVSIWIFFNAMRSSKIEFIRISSCWNLIRHLSRRIIIILNYSNIFGIFDPFDLMISVISKTPIFSSDINRIDDNYSGRQYGVSFISCWGGEAPCPPPPRGRN